MNGHPNTRNKVQPPVPINMEPILAAVHDGKQRSVSTRLTQLLRLIVQSLKSFYYLEDEISRLSAWKGLSIYHYHPDVELTLSNNRTIMLRFSASYPFAGGMEVIGLNATDKAKTAACHTMEKLCATL